MKTTNPTTCEAMRCNAQAVGRCPRCDMLLCAACLARHARYPGVAYQARHQHEQREDEEQQP